MTPRALHLIIKHLDCIDAAVSQRLTTARPWLEVGLTSLFCDLMDSGTQDSLSLAYPIDQLNADLAEPDGLLGLSVKIETHEYPPQLERWVTQSDLGLVLNYCDHLVPIRSWTSSWLLQAKRLLPSSRVPLEYSERCVFGSFDSAQHKRMLELNEVVGEDFIRYLFYCLQPRLLEPALRGKLSYLRTGVIANDIFDYTNGLELRDDLMASRSTLEAGLFLGPIDQPPPQFGEIHREIFRRYRPFSWFVADQLGSNGHELLGDPRHRGDKPPRGSVAHGIVTGDFDVIENVRGRLGIPDNLMLEFIPEHTIIINLGIGANFDPEQSVIQMEFPDEL